MISKIRAFEAEYQKHPKGGTLWLSGTVLAGLIAMPIFFIFKSSMSGFYSTLLFITTTLLLLPLVMRAFHAAEKSTGIASRQSKLDEFE